MTPRMYWALAAAAVLTTLAACSDDEPAAAGAATDDAGSTNGASSSSSGGGSGASSDGGGVVRDGGASSGDAATEAGPPAQMPTQLSVYVGNENVDLEQFTTWLGRPTDGVLGYTGPVSWDDMKPGYVMGQFPGKTIYFSIPLFPNNSTLQAVSDGEGDTHYAEYAQSILEHAIPAADGNIYVRTGWEMGGEWFPWGAQGNDHPELFTSAFAHFADVFHAASPKFKIVWDVTSDRGDVSVFYPGDQYVDVMSQDFYWEPQWTSEDPVTAFGIMRDRDWGLQWLEDFAAEHHKPTAYSEWGIRSDNAGPYIELVKAWFDEHHPLYQQYWNSNAAYPGKLSDNQYPAAGAKYRALFGAP